MFKSVTDMNFRLIFKLRPRAVVSRINIRPPTANFGTLLRDVSVANQLLIPRISQLNLQPHRLKSKKKSKATEVESESDSDESDDESEVIEENIAGSKTIKLTIPMRVDRLIRVASKIPRYKVEEAFYEGNIWKNDEKVMKKSEEAFEGDVVDLITGKDIKNPKLLRVTRVEIINDMSARVTKSMLVKDYTI